MLKDVFGIPIKYSNWNKEKFLPLYIAESYDFLEAIIDTQKCIMLTLKDDISTIPALRKHIKRIQEVDNVPIVLVLPTVSSYRRKSLIENKIPFVTEKQIYLPFIGTLLLEEKEVVKEVQKFMFSTQQLILLYFYNEKKSLYMSEATKKLPFSAMTLSRAVKQLEAINLFMITKDGVNKVIESKFNKIELYHKIKKYCSSPVRKIGYIKKTNLTKDMVLAGETALSEKTMLNPGKMKTYAIYHKYFDKKILMNELLDPEKQICLQVWEYDPKQFAYDNMADSLSILFSFKECEDERVEEAMKELLEKEFKE